MKLSQKLRLGAVTPPPSIPWIPSLLESNIQLSSDNVSLATGSVVSRIFNSGTSGVSLDFYQNNTSIRPPLVSSSALNNKNIIRFNGSNNYFEAIHANALSLTKNINSAWVFSLFQKNSIDLDVGDKPIIWIPRGTSGATRLR